MILLRPATSWAKGPASALTQGKITGQGTQFVACMYTVGCKGAESECSLHVCCRWGACAHDSRGMSRHFFEPLDFSLLPFLAVLNLPW